MKNKRLGEDAKKSLIIKCENIIKFVKVQKHYVYYEDLGAFIEELKRLKQNIKASNDFEELRGGVWVQLKEFKQNGLI